MNSNQVLSFLRSYLTLTLTTYPNLFPAKEFNSYMTDNNRLVALFNSSVVKNNIQETSRNFVRNLMGDTYFTSNGMLMSHKLSSSFITMYKGALAKSQKADNQAMKTAASIRRDDSAVKSNDLTTTPAPSQDGKDSTSVDSMSVIGMIGASYGFADFIKNISDRITMSSDSSATVDDEVIRIAKELVKEVSL